MATAAARRLLLLHALRLKGFANDEVVAERVGLSPGEAGSALAELANEGLVVHRDGRISGWALTADGRAAHRELVEAELSAIGCRAHIEAAYRRFLDLNQELLGVCTDWQLRPDAAGGQAPNDHTDAAYDRAVIARLAELDDRAQPVCAEVAGALPRFAGYGERLAAAREKLAAGDADWFTRPLIDSYHTVWFELHEDLLVTLGIERSSEGSG